MNKLVPICAKSALSLVAALWAAACSGPGFDPPARPSDSAGQTGGIPSGGDGGLGGDVGSGGVTATGGLFSSGGVVITGGLLTTGGSDGTGGSTAQPPGGECITDDQCSGVEPRCLHVWETWTAPAACGAPLWCGQCSCGPRPTLPYGTNSACLADADCQALSPDLHCGPAGMCEPCSTDAHCPAERPRCAEMPPVGGWSPVDPMRSCMECTTNDDCPSDTPACDTTPSVDGRSWGRCTECGAGIACEVGICVTGSCTPQCTTDTDCGSATSPLNYCSAQARCETHPCTSDSQCAAGRICNSGQCRVPTCEDDSACEAGTVCVRGQCRTEVGRCIDTHVMMVP